MKLKLLALTALVLSGTEVRALVPECDSLGSLEGAYNLATTLGSPDGNTFTTVTNSDGQPARIALRPIRRTRNGQIETIPGAYRVNTNSDFPGVIPGIFTLSTHNWVCTLSAYNGVGAMIPNLPDNPTEFIQAPELEEHVFTERTATGFSTTGHLFRSRWTKVGN